MSNFDLINAALNAHMGKDDFETEAQIDAWHDELDRLKSLRAKANSIPASVMRDQLGAAA